MRADDRDQDEDDDDDGDGPMWYRILDQIRASFKRSQLREVCSEDDDLQRAMKRLSLSEREKHAKKVKR